MCSICTILTATTATAATAATAATNPPATATTVAYRAKEPSIYRQSRREEIIYMYIW